MLEPPRGTPDQKLRHQLVSNENLIQLARRVNADDARRRKLTCVSFFWMAVLALGPSGFVTRHQRITFARVAQLMAGRRAAHAGLSKEAVSENWRERPWQFFATVLAYLLTTYAHVWQQLAGQPNALVVEPLQIWLIDASVMRVALRLFQQFPARATGQKKEWAALKLHLGLRLFQSLPEVLALTPERQNDHKVSFLRPAGEAVLYLFDWGYWGYQLFDTILDQGQQLLSRLRQDGNPLIIAHPQMRHDVRLVGHDWPRPIVWNAIRVGSSTSRAGATVRSIRSACWSTGIACAGKSRFSCAI